MSGDKAQTKTKVFILEDEEGASVLSLKDVLFHIQAYLEEAENGDEFSFEIKRQDMTGEALAALPEV